MSAQTHVTVVGAGIVGVCAALHLQRLGCRVTVVDRLAPGEATSFGNACMITDSSMVPITGPGIVKSGLKMLLNPNGPLFIRPTYAAKVTPWLYRFVREGKLERVQHSAKALSELLRGALAEHHELADNTPAARWIGDQPSLFVYESRQQQRAEALAWSLREANGVAFEPVDATELRAIEPALHPKFQWAMRMSGHGRALNPSKLTKAHADWLAGRGGEVLRREVRGVEISDQHNDHGRGHAGRGHAGRATRLLTDQGPLELDKLLIAAGPWSAKWCAEFGDQVPLEGEGGYHLTLTEPGITLNHPLMVTAAKIAITPMELGVRVGGLVEFAGVDAMPEPARQRLLLQGIQETLPQINAEAYTDWRGSRPSLPDSLPVIDQASRCDNVFYAFGNQHVGLSSGPKTGKLVAQLITGQPLAMDLAPFRVARF